ncbi:hypothetical protein FHT08_002163 [Xanthomonas campestris]|nr:hypothetical protein [Xanthomonas sp. CFBP 8152]NIJ77080.1 hypothetical protein [Xanthomonas sp. CFBP 8151]
MIALTALVGAPLGARALPVTPHRALVRSYGFPALVHHTHPRLRNHASGTSMLSTITPSAQ